MGRKVQGGSFQGLEKPSGLGSRSAVLQTVRRTPPDGPAKTPAPAQANHPRSKSLDRRRSVYRYEDRVIGASVSPGRRTFVSLVCAAEAVSLAAVNAGGHRTG